MLNSQLWGGGLICLLLGTGIRCLCAGRFAPLRSLRLAAGRRQRTAKHGLSPFQACMTSLAAAMGTGNIAGVASALTIGGPGAVFWMWAAAVPGMGLIFAENVLSCQWRSGCRHGAAAYLRTGLRSPLLAGAFAVCCVAASFGMGNMTQSHAMAQTLDAAMRIPPVVTGIAAALLTAAVILGGARRIGRFAALTVPVVTVVYLCGCGVVLWHCRDRLGEAFVSIFEGAFGLGAVGGGITGAAVRSAVSAGVRRGIFSNEAGLGSSGLLHGEMQADVPEFAGVCGMLEVFADTFVCCTATALAVLCSGAMESGAEGTALVLEAFRTGMGGLADWILPPVTALFALCTLVGWSYCGSSALSSLTNGRYLTAYRVCFCIMAAAGAVMHAELVWTIADIANACMAYCNLPGLLLLYNPGKNAHTAGKETKGGIVYAGNSILRRHDSVHSRSDAS